MNDTQINQTLLMMSANTPDEAADILEGIAALLRKEIDGYNGLPPGDHCIIAQLYADGAVTTVDVMTFAGEANIRTVAPVDRASWDFHCTNRAVQSFANCNLQRQSKDSR